MISIEVYQNQNWINRIKVSGHAYSNDPGKDLVCAGVSCVMTGLLNSFIELKEYDYSLTYQQDPALIQIETKKPTEKGQLILKIGLIQCETIAEQYPQYIQINYRRT